MELFVGLNVSQELTPLCVISDDGQTVWQGKCSSTPDDIAVAIRSKAHDVVRIGLESGPLATGSLIMAFRKRQPRTHRS